MIGVEESGLGRWNLQGGPERVRQGAVKPDRAVPAPCASLVLETLDIKDSELFRKTMIQKKWEEVTPTKARKRKTYQDAPPDDGELEEYAGIAPDWFYLSGHHGRGTCDTKNKLLSLSAFPTGFFNEPFHKKEFETARRDFAPKGMFVQTESLTDEDGLNRLETYWRGRFAEEGDPDNFADMIPYWLDLFSKPTEDVTRPAFKDRARSDRSRPQGAVFRQRVGGRAADRYRGVQHAGLREGRCISRRSRTRWCLGYINKNPLDSTPHVRAFLDNAFNGISNPKDPLLLDHDHLSEAWMNVHFKQKLAATAHAWHS